MDEAQKLLHRCRALSQQVLVLNKRFAGEWDAIREEVDSIQAQLKSIKAQARGEGEPSANADLASITRECDQVLRTGPGGDLRKFLKRQKKPLILRLMLGQHCPVQVARNEEAFKLKEEYHHFRAMTARMLIVLSGTLLYLMSRSLNISADPLRFEPLKKHTFTPMIMVGVQALLVWLIYVYCAMASRESLLLLNGSNIRSWWIWHHYLSALTCIIVLTLPVDSAQLQLFVKGWLQWTVLQAVLMLLQNMYQRKRMYTRIALGKSSAMDVVGGESSGMPGQLIALLPGLFLLQCWQLFLGATMVLHTGRAVIDPRGWLELEEHESELWAMRGLFIVGSLMTYMGMMNALATISTVRAKRRDAVRARQAAKTQ